MAFIVEIFRSPQIKTTGIDIRITGSVWNKLLALAKSEGWEPRGTVISPESSRDPKNYINDYEPDYPDSKRITTEDALNISKALKKVRDKMSAGELEIKVRGPMVICENETPPEGFKIFTSELKLWFLDRFIQYCEIGAFEFWWDD